MPIVANSVCHSRAEQYSRWAPNLCCGVCGVTKPGSSKIEAILGRHTILLSCGKSELQSWLNLATSLITKERPYVFRSSLGAIWTPQDWHEMVSASAGLSCMTSHGVGICWCHSFSVLKSPPYCSGLAERTSKRILVCPKDAAKFEDVVASNNPAAKTCWVNGVSQDCTCSQKKQEVYEVPTPGNLDNPRSRCQETTDAKLPRVPVCDRQTKQSKHPQKTKTKDQERKANQPGETKNLVKHAPDYCKTSLGCMGRLRNTEKQCMGSDCQDQAGSITMVASKRKAGGPRRLPKHHIEKTQWSPNLGHGLPVPTFAGTRSNTLRPWVLSLPRTCLATLAKASAPLDGQTVSGVARFPRTCRKL